MNLLCGTDFSPNAADAVTTAAALARRFNEPLELVHASQPPVDMDPTGSGSMTGLVMDVWTPVKDVLKQQLDAECKRLRATGIKVKPRLELGRPAEALRQRAKPGVTRMIVVSSVGRVGLARVLLGSTADRVAESAPVPTLVVRNAVPFREWLDGKRPLRVLVAADYTTASEGALAFVRELAQAGPCELLIGHLADPARDHERLGLGTGEPATEPSSPSLQGTLERDLREHAAGVLGDLRFRLAVETSGTSVADGIIGLAKAHRADLIVTGTHQHHGLARLWHQSTSRGLLADAPMSVACVPVQAQFPGAAPIPRLSRVLVTTDFSATGNLAVSAACALLPVGGRLRLLHVVPPLEAAFSLLGGNPRHPTLSPGEHQELLRHAKRRLGSLFPAEAFRRGITP